MYSASILTLCLFHPHAVRLFFQYDGSTILFSNTLLLSKNYGYPFSGYILPAEGGVWAIINHSLASFISQRSFSFTTHCRYEFCCSRDKLVTIGLNVSVRFCSFKTNMAKNRNTTAWILKNHIHPTINDIITGMALNRNRVSLWVERLRASRRDNFSRFSEIAVCAISL